MTKYKIHFLNSENNYTIVKEFTDKNLPFKPNKPSNILEVENTYFLYRYTNNDDYFYKKVEGELVSISQEEIDKEWYMILNWDYITLTGDVYDE